MENVLISLILYIVLFFVYFYNVCYRYQTIILYTLDSICQLYIYYLDYIRIYIHIIPSKNLYEVFNVPSKPLSC